MASSSSSNRPSASRPAAAPPDSPTAPTLLPHGKHKGKPGMALNRPFTLAGARNRAHLHLVSSSVSKCHAAIIHDNGRVYIRDLCSRTHVYVNGRLIHEMELADGDLLQIGSFTFRLRHSATVADVPTPAPGQLVEINNGGDMLPLDGRTAVIGRRPGCDLQIEDESVSTIHAIIFELDSLRYVRDLGSRTGTFVNGTAAHQQPLNFNDRLRVGPKEFVYRPAEAGSGSFDDMDELEDLVGTARLGHDELLGFTSAGGGQTIAEPGVPVQEGISTEPTLDDTRRHDRNGTGLPGMVIAAGAGAAMAGAADDLIPLAGEDDDILPLASDHAPIAEELPPADELPPEPIDLDADSAEFGGATVAAGDTVGLAATPVIPPTISPLVEDFSAQPANAPASEDFAFETPAEPVEEFVADPAGSAEPPVYTDSAESTVSAEPEPSHIDIAGAAEMVDSSTDLGERSPTEPAIDEDFFAELESDALTPPPQQPADNLQSLDLWASPTPASDDAFATFEGEPAEAAQQASDVAAETPVETAEVAAPIADEWVDAVPPESADTLEILPESSLALDFTDDGEISPPAAEAEILPPEEVAPQIAAAVDETPAEPSAIEGTPNARGEPLDLPDLDDLGMSAHVIGVMPAQWASGPEATPLAVGPRDIATPPDVADAPHWTDIEQDGGLLDAEPAIESIAPPLPATLETLPPVDVDSESLDVAEIEAGDIDPSLTEIGSYDADPNAIAAGDIDPDAPIEDDLSPAAPEAAMPDIAEAAENLPELTILDESPIAVVEPPTEPGAAGPTFATSHDAGLDFLEESRPIEPAGPAIATADDFADLAVEPAITGTAAAAVATVAAAGAIGATASAVGLAGSAASSPATATVPPASSAKRSLWSRLFGRKAAPEPAAPATPKVEGVVPPAAAAIAPAVVPSAQAAPVGHEDDAAFLQAVDTELDATPSTTEDSSLDLGRDDMSWPPTSATAAGTSPAAPAIDVPSNIDLTAPSHDSVEAAIGGSPALDLPPGDATFDLPSDAATTTEESTAGPLPTIGVAEITLSGLGGHGSQIVLSGMGPVDPVWGLSSNSSPGRLADDLWPADIESTAPMADLLPPVDAAAAEPPPAIEESSDLLEPLDDGPLQAFGGALSATPMPSFDLPSASMSTDPAATLSDELPEGFFEDLIDEQAAADATAAASVDAPPTDAPAGPVDIAEAGNLLEVLPDEPAVESIAPSTPETPAPTSEPTQAAPDAPPVDPFSFMGRDQGSFFGGMPLPLGSLAPQAPAAPSRPRLPFADRPVTMETRADVLAEVTMVEPEHVPLFGAPLPPGVRDDTPFRPIESDLAPLPTDDFGRNTISAPPAGAPAAAVAEVAVAGAAFAGVADELPPEMVGGHAEEAAPESPTPATPVDEVIAEPVTEAVASDVAPPTEPAVAGPVESESFAAPSQAPEQGESTASDDGFADLPDDPDLSPAPDTAETSIAETGNEPPLEAPTVVDEFLPDDGLIVPEPIDPLSIEAEPIDAVEVSLEEPVTEAASPEAVEHATPVMDLFAFENVEPAAAEAIVEPAQSPVETSPIIAEAEVLPIGEGELLVPETFPQESPSDSFTEMAPVEFAGATETDITPPPVTAEEAVTSPIEPPPADILETIEAPAPDELPPVTALPPETVVIEDPAVAAEQAAADLFATEPVTPDTVATTFIPEPAEAVAGDIPPEVATTEPVASEAPAEPLPEGWHVSEAELLHDDAGAGGDDHPFVAEHIEPESIALSLPAPADLATEDAAPQNQFSEPDAALIDDGVNSKPDAQAMAAVDALLFVEEPLIDAVSTTSPDEVQNLFEPNADAMEENVSAELGGIATDAAAAVFPEELAPQTEAVESPAIDNDIFDASPASTTVEPIDAVADEASANLDITPVPPSVDASVETAPATIDIFDTGPASTTVEPVDAVADEASPNLDITPIQPSANASVETAPATIDEVPADLFDVPEVDISTTSTPQPIELPEVLTTVESTGPVPDLFHDEHHDVAPAFDVAADHASLDDHTVMNEAALVEVLADEPPTLDEPATPSTPVAEGEADIARNAEPIDPTPALTPATPAASAAAVAAGAAALVTPKPARKPLPPRAVGGKARPVPRTAVPRTAARPAVPGGPKAPAPAAPLARKLEKPAGPRRVIAARPASTPLTTGFRPPAAPSAPAAVPAAPARRVVQAAPVSAAPAAVPTPAARPPARRASMPAAAAPRDPFTNTGDLAQPASQPPKPSKKRLMLILLAVMMTAAVIVAVWLMMGPAATVQGRLQYRGLEDARITPEARKAFQMQQIAALTERSVLEDARRQIFDKSMSLGILEESKEQTIRLNEALSAARWDDRGIELVVDYPNSIDAADRTRMLALLTAAKRRYDESPRASLGDETKLKQVKDRAAAIEIDLSRLAGSRSAAERQVADGPTRLAEAESLRKKAEQLKANFEALPSKILALQKEITRLENLPSLAANAAVASDDNDPELRRLSEQLRSLNASLSAAMETTRTGNGESKAALDAAQQQFDAQVAAARDAAAGNVVLAGYLEKLQALQFELRRHNEELAQQQKDQRQMLDTLRRRLAEETAARIQRAWDADPQLKVLSTRRAVAERQFNVASSANLPDVKELGEKMADLDKQIEALRSLIAAKDEYEPMTKQFRSFIDDSVKLMDQSRQRNEKRLKELFDAFIAAKPDMDKLPADQKARAAALDEAFEALSSARAQYDGVVAEATTRADIAVQDLTQQVAAQQAKVDARRKELAEARSEAVGDEPAPNLAMAEPERLAAIQAKRNELTEARQSEVKLQNDWAQASLSASRARAEADQAEASRLTLEKLDAERAALSDELHKVQQQIADSQGDPLAAVTVAEVAPSAASMVPAEDKRAWYSFLAAGGGLFLVLAALAASRSPGVYIPPMSHTYAAYDADEPHVAGVAAAVPAEPFAMRRG